MMDLVWFSQIVCNASLWFWMIWPMANSTRAIGLWYCHYQHCCHWCHCYLHMHTVLLVTLFMPVIFYIVHILEYFFHMCTSNDLTGWHICKIWWAFWFLADNGNNVWNSVTVGCILAYMCKNVRFICPISIIVVWAIFAMWPPYFFCDFMSCVQCSLWHGWWHWLHVPDVCIDVPYKSIKYLAWIAYMPQFMSIFVCGTYWAIVYVDITFG